MITDTDDNITKEGVCCCKRSKVLFQNGDPAGTFGETFLGWVRTIGCALGKAWNVAPKLHQYHLK